MKHQEHEVQARASGLALTLSPPSGENYWKGEKQLLTKCSPVGRKSSHRTWTSDEGILWLRRSERKIKWENLVIYLRQHRLTQTTSISNILLFQLMSDCHSSPGSSVPFCFLHPYLSLSSSSHLFSPSWLLPSPPLLCYLALQRFFNDLFIYFFPFTWTVMVGRAILSLKLCLFILLLCLLKYCFGKEVSCLVWYFFLWLYILK